MAKRNKKNNPKLAAGARPLFASTAGFHKNRVKDVAKRSSRAAKHKGRLPENG